MYVPIVNDNKNPKKNTFNKFPYFNNNLVPIFYMYIAKIYSNPTNQVVTVVSVVDWIGNTKQNTSPFCKHVSTFEVATLTFITDFKEEPAYFKITILIIVKSIIAAFFHCL